MASDSDLSTELAAFEERWERITEVPESPRTLMSVIEYSLGSNRKAEEYVNRLLRYLLDPEAPHGLGPDFLEAFLEGLPASCNFREDTFDLSDVRVRDQVQIDGLQDSDRTGYVDLVVDVPAEWFLLVELKFSADEGRLSSAGLTQTEFYYEAAKLGDREKSAYESGAYYLYVHPADRPGAESPNFSNLTWSTLTEDVIDPFIAQNAPRLPQRTVGQLRELVDDLGQITGMTPEQSNRQEKVELYLEHVDAIEDVGETFDERWGEFTDEWYTRLADRIDDDATLRNWVFWEHSDDWAYLYKAEWWRRASDFEPTGGEPVDGNTIRVGFLHRLQRNRDDAIRDHTLKFYFRNCPPNRHTGDDNTNFRDEFTDRFEARSDEIEALLPDSARLTGNLNNLIEASYDIPVGEYDGFFEAYVGTLHRAFADHVVDNPALVEAIDDVYHETLDEFRE